MWFPSKKSIVTTGALLCMSTLCLQSTELQLIAPSYEQCLEQSYTIGRTLEFAYYVRAIALTASMVGMLYVIYNFATGKESPKKADDAPVTKQPWFSLQTAQSLGLWLAKASAQTICGQWIANKVMVNRRDPKIFIPKQNHAYKTHAHEIERLLALRAADEYLGGDCAEIDLLILGHLQALIDKINILIAYMIYYAGARAPAYTELQIQHYAQEVIKKMGLAAEQFNTRYTTNFDEAVLACKKSCHEQLTSAIRYALSSLPSDE